METVNNGAAIVKHQTPTKAVNGQPLPDLGNSVRQHRLAMRAEERAVGVLADPLALKQAGAAVPLLAVVNERCGEQDVCRMKYADVAVELNVSVTTVKVWAESLAKLGYFTRAACGPAGVEIRLCAERWPGLGTGSALAAATDRIVQVLGAVRLTVDRALASAADEARRVGKATV